MTISNRTFGVELELKGMRPGDAARALGAAGIPAEEVGYTHARRNYWKCLTDGSLCGTSCEVVSPVLSGEDGIEQVRKVARALAQAGARIDRECGLHVHVGTDDLTGHDAAMVLARYARFESTIDSWMPTSRRGGRNHYCQSITDLVSRRVQGRSFRTIRDVASAMGGDRYMKVNMQAYSRHRTIEFRQHSGSCNATKIENWIRFVIGFVDASRNQATMVDAPAESSYGRAARRGYGSRIRRNSMERKLDAVIVAFRNAPGHRLSIGEIAQAGGWSQSSVPPYITRLRRERACQIRKIRGTHDYVLVGNSGRLSTDQTSPAVAVETQRAARRVQGVADLASDSVFRGIDEEVVSYFEERRSELADRG